ncbi:MAG: hypothetical protein GKS06_15970 [Acidobacteria bacterium]|nr:hypothetical protein [Acidobacteriota bacterium]
MRLISFNMRSGGARDWQHALDLSPDLAFLQEAKAPTCLGESLSRELGRRIVWEAVEHGRWGSGLLLPRTPEAILEVPGYGGWVVGAAARLWKWGPVCRVFSLHVPARHSGYVRTVHEVLDRILAIDHDGPLLLGGDLNVATARRVALEARKTTPRELRLLDRIENDMELTNSWVLCHPDEPLAQTLRWTGNPATPYHCDGIFLPTAWNRRVKAAEVLQGEPWETVSDHNPVVVDFASRG